jgi:hypothetical protein
MIKTIQTIAQLTEKEVIVKMSAIKITDEEIRLNVQLIDSLTGKTLLFHVAIYTNYDEQYTPTIDSFVSEMINRAYHCMVNDKEFTPIP